MATRPAGGPDIAERPARRPTLRPAREEDVPDVARIWSEGWREAHLGSVPERLVAARTSGSFRDRASDLLPVTTVADVAGEVAGFIMVEQDEVQQLYVDPRYRGAVTASAPLAAPGRAQQAGGARDGPSSVRPVRDHVGARSRRGPRSGSGARGTASGMGRWLRRLR